MTKKRIADVFLFLASARLAKMTDEEKVAIIRLFRVMKPIAQEVQQAVSDATAKVSEETTDQQEIVRLVNLSVTDILEAETEVNTKILSLEGFSRLTLSNDWTLGQIDELEEIFLQ